MLWLENMLRNHTYDQKRYHLFSPALLISMYFTSSLLYGGWHGWCKVVEAQSKSVTFNLLGYMTGPSSSQILSTASRASTATPPSATHHPREPVLVTRTVEM